MVTLYFVPTEPKLKNFLQHLGQLSKVTFLTDKYLSEASLESTIFLCDFVSLYLPLSLTDDANCK